MKKENDAFICEVVLNPGFADAAGVGVLTQAKGLGLKSIEQIRFGKLFSVDGSFTDEDKTEIAKLLFCDPVMENYFINAPVKEMTGFNWRAEIWFKPSVTDVYGEGVKDALKDIGYITTRARTGRAYYIKGGSRKEVETLILKALINPLIHQYELSGL